MRWMCLAMLMIGACGDDADKGDVADTVALDTASSETTAPDGVADSIELETNAETSEPDTVVPVDTSAPETVDTSAPETTPSKCGCAGGTTCIEANAAANCPAVVALCGSGQQAVAECSSEDVMASCVRASTTLTYYYSRADDYLVQAKQACDNAGTDATFSVTPIPAPVGDVCSCQRTAAACVQTYGATCDTLSCDAGVQAAPCPAAGRIAARCVSRDAQRELVFYSAAASEDDAQLACLGASAVEYFWFPAGL